MLAFFEARSTVGAGKRAKIDTDVDSLAPSGSTLWRCRTSTKGKESFPAKETIRLTRRLACHLRTQEFRLRTV